MIIEGNSNHTKELRINLTGLQLIWDFVHEWQGPKLSIVVVGGGNLLADMVKIPGASRVVQGIYQPYDDDAILDFLDCMGGGYPQSKKAVSKERAKDLFSSIFWSTRNGICITITAATISSRYRKGLDQAWYMITGMEEPELIALEKVHEETYNKLTPEEIYSYRAMQDYQITTTVLNKLKELHGGTKST